MEPPRILNKVRNNMAEEVYKKTLYEGLRKREREREGGRKEEPFKGARVCVSQTRENSRWWRRTRIKANRKNPRALLHPRVSQDPM